MNRLSLVGAAVCAVVAPACASRSPTTGETIGRSIASSVLVQQIEQADRDFSADVSREGTEAWVRWFAPDGRQIVPGKQRVGRDAIREEMKDAFSDPTRKLVWWPDHGAVASSGDVGWTTGRYEVRKTGADGAITVLSTGRYLTVWRRQPDGTWKVEADIGNPDPRTP